MFGLKQLAGVAAGAGVAFVAYLFLKEDGEPAAPIKIPDLPPNVPHGASGIKLDDNEIEALGRVIASEAGSGTSAEQKAIGWTVRNRFRGKSIYAVEYPWRSQKGSDPPFASARDATDKTRALAREILNADQSQDPTGGATSFFEPRMQDIFFKAGELARKGETGDRVIDGQKLTDITRFKNYKKDAQGIRDSWGKGSAQLARAGRFEFWGRSSLLAQRGGQVIDILGLNLLGAEG